MSNCRTLKFYVGKMYCDSKMYCIYGAEIDVFINFMWSVYLSIGYNIPLILPLSYHLELGRCDCGTTACQ